MKRITKSIIYIIIILILLLYCLLKSIEVEKVKADNEQLYDNWTLKLESIDQQIQAYNDTIIMLRKKLDTQ